MEEDQQASQESIQKQTDNSYEQSHSPKSQRSQKNSMLQKKRSQAHLQKSISKRSNASNDEHEMRLMLQMQKRQLKEQNYKLKLERLEREEEVRQDKQIFQNCNQDLDMVRQVRLYKQVKNDLFSWGQLLTIVSDFIIACSFVFLGFALLSIGLNSYPFIMTFSTNIDIQTRFMPTSANGSMAFAWIIHFLSIFVAMDFLSIGIFARLLRQKRRIEYAFKLQRIVVYSGIAINLLFLLIYIFGNLYISKLEESLYICASDFQKNEKMCKELCIRQFGTTPVSSASNCRKFVKSVEAASPLLMLAMTCLLCMSVLTTFLYYLRKLFRTYRHKLELYQILLVEFIPDKISELAVVHQPQMELIPEDEDEYCEHSSYGGPRRGRVISQQVTSHPPNLMRRGIHSSVSNDMRSNNQTSTLRAASVSKASITGRSGGPKGAVREPMVAQHSSDMPYRSRQHLSEATSIQHETMSDARSDDGSPLQYDHNGNVIYGGGMDIAIQENTPLQNEPLRY